MFVDAASRHVKVEFQTFFSAQETIDTIKRCEQKARDKGIMIQECQFDNGSSFTSRSTQDSLPNQGQTCSPEAHKIACSTKDKEANSPELEVIMKMEEPKEV